MVAILFAISGVAAVAGVGAILVGFPNYEFGLGNTLIMSGAVAIVGAMIVFGLAATVRELRRVGRLLERPARQPRPEAEAAARAGGRPGAAARPQPLSPGRRAPEQRLGPIPSADRPAADFPPLRPSALDSGEPSVVEEVETVPISPAAPGRSVPTPPPASPPPEPRFERRPEPPPAPSMRPQPSRPTRNIFDPSWSRGGGGRSEPERAAPERAAPPQPEEQANPFSEQISASQPTPAQQMPISILKSGVIDGMAYTLYTDGSIEAQLPSGVVRFASIDELREHLEKHS
ncbi:MAG: hypothetical protein JO289_20555 [Xanthobacteraceae bacterium]|nr:hypothetical protein [Xanthobacteraceae bacterium]